MGSYSVKFNTMCDWSRNRDTVLVSKGRSRTMYLYWYPIWPELEEKLTEAFTQHRKRKELVRRRWFRQNSIRLFTECYPDKLASSFSYSYTGGSRDSLDEQV